MSNAEWFSCRLQFLRADLKTFRLEDRFYCSDRVAVDFYSVVNLFSVATRHNRRNWNLTLVALAQHKLVAQTQSRHGQRKFAEFVSGEWIRTGEIENYFRLMCEDSRQVLREYRQVFLV